MTPALEALTALQAQLQTISTANGYLTDLALVGLGQDALALDRHELPALTLQSSSEALDDGSAEINASQPFQLWKRTVNVTGVVLETDSDHWESLLDALLLDLRRALVGYVRPLLMTGPQFFPPNAAGEAALFTLTLTIEYALNLS